MKAAVSCAVEGKTLLTGMKIVVNPLFPAADDTAWLNKLGLNNGRVAVPCSTLFSLSSSTTPDSMAVGAVMRTPEETSLPFIIKLSPGSVTFTFDT